MGDTKENFSYKIVLPRNNKQATTAAAAVGLRLRSRRVRFHLPCWELLLIPLLQPPPPWWELMEEEGK